MLTGSTAANLISGGSGNDSINGGAGNDTMMGGAGNDTYVVDATGDIVDETSGAGTDTVESTVTFSLSSATQVRGNVENLSLLGTGAINGTGNALANVITGNSGNNILAGLGGADTLTGGLGLDTASYAASGSGVTVSLTTGTGSGGDAEGDTLNEIENLTGSNHNDVLEGSSGNNALTGGLGIDTATYAAASAGVKVSLALTTAQNTFGAGIDTLSGIENLTGSNHDDVLTGSTAANLISGGSGNDSINGGAGNDTMMGGTGADSFVFNSALGATNIDTLSDFSVIDDTIQLENTGVFTGLTAIGVLSASAFRTGSAALDADDRILYDIDTGRVLYDVDGLGVQSAVQFASLATGLSLTSADFLVI